MRTILKIFKWILNIIIALVLFIGVINFLPSAPMSAKGKNPFRKAGDMPLNIPHGGAKLLAPENTVYSYKFLLKDEEYDFDDIEGELPFDVKVLEIDLALTKDEILITHHDLMLDKDVFGSDVFIRDYTYDEIVDMYEDSNFQVGRNFYDPNFWSEGASVPIAPPEEYFKDMVPAHLENELFKPYYVYDAEADKFINENPYLYILEIKDTVENGVTETWSNTASQALVDLIKKYELQNQVVLSSFSDDVIAHFRELMPEAITNFGVGETTNFAIFSAFYIDFFWKTKSQVLIIPNYDSYGTPLGKGTADLLDKIPNFISGNIARKDENGDYKPDLAKKQLIDDAHRKNIAVFFWTINDEQEMEELIKLGVDGIITDLPDLLHEVIERVKKENN